MSTILAEIGRAGGKGGRAMIGDNGRKWVDSSLHAPRVNGVLVLVLCVASLSLKT